MAVDSSASTTTNQTLYLGLGVGIGGLLLVAIIAVCIQLARKIRQSKRQTQLLEQGQLHHPEVQQRRSHDHRTSLGLGRRPSVLVSQAHWDALSSTDSIDQQNVQGRVPSTHKPKKSKKRGIQLKRLKHLSAITESPRSRAGQSPAIPTIRQVHDASIQEAQHADFIEESDKPVGYAETADVPIRPQSDSGKVYGLGLTLPVGPFNVADSGRPKPPRSVSVGVLTSSAGYVMTARPVSTGNRVRMHVRSVSLGGQPPEQLPPDPTPNLPVISPHESSFGIDAASLRDSMSSQGSTSSSVLRNSPMPLRQGPREQVSIKPTTLRYSMSLSSQSAPGIVTRTDDFDVVRSEKMFASDGQVSPLSDHGDLKRELPSTSSISSFDDDMESPSFRRVTNANLPSKTRVSPARSTRPGSGKRTISRTVSRSTVSANGSPTQKNKSGVLRDLSNNSLLPSRQLSNATQNSNHSSDGNPFQWDNMSLQKPSALKGSPNARKGHRRQNCVRISTLTPQVLGPPPSRSTSPNITHRIQEESEDDISDQKDEMMFVTNRRPSRPLSNANSAPLLRIQTLRASLTPTSPTLSMWTAFQDQALPSQPSDSHLTASTGNLSRTTSNLSSSFSIPSFPSPSRATTSEVQRTQPLPEFCISDSPEMASSPFDTNITSSPPVLSPSQRSYDPAWPPMPQVDMAMLRKYDPASPLAPRRLFERTPPPEDSTITLSDASSGGKSQLSGSTVTPPVRERSSLRSNTLTSANASSIMAGLSAFPGAPVLSPPRDDNPVPPPLWFQGERSPEPDIPPSIQSEYAEDRSRLTGPRVAPAKSVLKNAMALRRMNSEIDTTACRESRRYLQLGREGSPSLPLYNSPHMSDSCSSFDFGFQRELDAASGAIDSVGIVSGSVFCRESSSFYHDLPTIVETSSRHSGEDSGRRRGNKRRAIAMGKENQWEEVNGSDDSTDITFNHEPKQPYRGSTQQQPRSSTTIASWHRSMQGTPRSLYDADGFLK